ncbi:hypothetical protein [Bacteroides sp.]|uniref:hypothetical protein n=1 Tax=Bacteroides sp. TaxID=29523 RepID=UPI002610F514|nr:hypothetical protein [Bacteroides sp.]MDD3038845.1 hypothetical protein [Bacteroides sp.]
MSKIKRIAIVTAVGANIYAVGIGGVTHIVCADKRVSEELFVDIYRVMNGRTTIAEISASCPLVIDYEEE